MVSSNVQQIYEEHVAVLSAGERLRLVELITRGMAQPETADLASPATVAAAVEALRDAPGWHHGDRRGDFSEWRDRAL